MPESKQNNVRINPDWDPIINMQKLNKYYAVYIYYYVME